MIGGIAEMTTLIKEIHQNEPNVFLFDSGDIFTGALAKLASGGDFCKDHGRGHNRKKTE